MRNGRRKIVFFNGPPRCGKDSGVGLVAAKTGGMRVSFAEPLKLQTAALLGVTLEQLEFIKDQPHPALKGGTPRQYMINLSEKMIKPCYGDDFFGHVAVDRIERDDELGISRLVLFSDSGFKGEAVPVVNKYGLVNCAKIEIHRKDCDFSKDSRSYWHMDGLETIVLENNGTLQEFQTMLLWRLSQINFV